MTAGARPLSEGQRALWFLHRMAPAGAAYNVVTAVRVRPMPDTEVLARAVTEVARRHELIRSVFTERDGTPWRTPADPAAVRLQVLPDTNEEDLETATRLGRVPFRLADGELPVRWTLVPRPDGEALLVLAAHHLVTDASSQWILLADLLDAYRAPDAATPPPAPYDEHVERERRLLDGPEREAHAEYWKAECAGVPALELPPDRFRPARQTFDGATCKLPVPPEVAARVPEVARELGVTPFALLLGTLAAVLHQRAGGDDGLLGCSVTLRRGNAQRGTVGYLVNTIPVRARFGAATTLADAARDTHRRLLEGLRHSRYPFAALVRDLGTSHRAPALRVCVTHVGAGPLVPLSRLMPGAEPVGPPVEYGGLLLRQVDVPQMEGQFDLTVELRQGAGKELTVVLRHAAELFEPATAEQLGRHFVRLLETAVADPSAPAGNAPPAVGDELRQVLAWSTGSV